MEAWRLHIERMRVSRPVVAGSHQFNGSRIRLLLPIEVKVGTGFASKRRDGSESAISDVYPQPCFRGLHQVVLYSSGSWHLCYVLGKKDLQSKS